MWIDLPVVVLIGLITGIIFGPLFKNRRRATKSPRDAAEERVALRSPKMTPTSSFSIPRHTVNYDEWRRILRERTIPSRITTIDPGTQVSNDYTNGKILVERWRKSVVGLMKMAEKNLVASKQRLAMSDYKAAFEHAATAVENVARSLIHCFGGKPDSDFGQEEALKMLSARFLNEEKAAFQKAIDDVARITRDRAIVKQLSPQNPDHQLFGEKKAKQAIDIAYSLIVLFRRIVTERFTLEIPELSEACPKCGSLDVSVRGFVKEDSTHFCSVCHHAWTELYR